MKVSNGQVWQARAALQTVLKEAWPVKTAYALAKLGRKLNEQYAVVEEVRVKLIHQYGTADEKGRTEIKSDHPRYTEFVVALNELMEALAEIDGEPVSLPEVEGVKIAPADLLLLDSFVSLA